MSTSIPQSPSGARLGRPSPALVRLGVSGLILLVFGWLVFEYAVNRIYVPQGYSLQLRFKGPPLPFLPGNLPPAESGAFAKVDPNRRGGWPLEKGILEELVGPGRHFYCPLWWERKLVKDTEVKPGQVALVTSRMGGELPPGEFLVDGDLGEAKFKGTLRRVFGPGTYRFNPYAYEFNLVETVREEQGSQVKHSGWVDVPTGHVGVVTNLTHDPSRGILAGIQDKVLPPGLYPVNPREQKIDLVLVGWYERSIVANLRTRQDGTVMFDPSGEPALADDNSGITFPSADGFTIHMDFTAIWGVLPDHAANVIRTFGNVPAVENKVVIPQIESICRNMGSKLRAVELLEGDSRRKFQDETRDAFHAVLDEKGIALQLGLVRHIYIPQEVRFPIQESHIADELKQTREQEQLTTKTEATLSESKQKVLLEAETIRVGTDKLVAQKIAEGNRTAAETEAETVKLVAAIDRQAAELDAQATVVRGEATSGAKKLLEEARSDKFRLAVAAFGSGKAYNEWVFASGLPEDIQLQMLYAGQGTFWTDLRGFTETLLGKQAQESRSLNPPRPNPTAPGTR